MGNTGSSRVPNKPSPRFLGYHSAPNFAICHVCNRNIERWDNLRQLTFWGLKFCKMHEVDGTPRCSGCNRFQIEGQMEYVNLGDGRKLCSDCYSIAIFDPSKCNRLIEKMREFYKELNLEVDKDIPILLVDKDYMDKRQGAIGLTTFDHRKVWTITNYSKNGDNIQVQKAKKTLTKGKVTSILLLFGMPDVIMGAILAHEMMHAWLLLKGCKKLDRKVCEGICEVMAHLWLEWFCDEGKNNLDSYTTEQAEFTKNLKILHAYKITTRDDKIYGDGFREAQRAVSTSNLHKTLQHIVRHKTLPPRIHSNSTC
ncbi:unnamed protein product [Prunus brigantina]